MKVRFNMGMGLVGCKRSEIVEIDDEDLEGMSDGEIDTYVEELLTEWVDGYVEYWWEEE